MTERRTSVESRLDILELKVFQLHENSQDEKKERDKEREEVLKLLKNIEINQAKISTTIDGGVALTYITIVAAVGWVVQYLFSKFFHD